MGAGSSGAPHELRPERLVSEDEERDAAVARLESALGHRYADRDLLEAALRHSSYAHERSHERGSERTRDDGGEDDAALESNERLEFLGDAVLGLVVAESLYAAKPDWREGDLTRALHRIVEGSSLAKLAARLGVGPAMRFGRTEESSGGAEKPRVLEDAMEALIGAMYLDAGLDAVRTFVRGNFAEALAADATRVARDPKTALQERLMRDVGAFPSYRLVEDTGVEGDDRRFSVEVVSQGDVLGGGTARTKRAAEKKAAREALRKQAPATEDG